MTMYFYYLKLAWVRCHSHPLTTVLIVGLMALGISSFMITMSIFLAFEGEAIPGVSSHLYVVTMDAREMAVTEATPYDTPKSLLRLVDGKALVAKQPKKVGAAAVAAAKVLTRVSNASSDRSAFVYGLMAYGSVSRTLGISLLSGRSWSREEQYSHNPVVIIGKHLASKLFGTLNVVGNNIVINGHTFRIIGVAKTWKPRFQFIDAHGLIGKDMQIFFPLGSALDAGLGPLTSGNCEESSVNVTYGSVNLKKCRWLEVWVSLRSKTFYKSYKDFLTNYAEHQHDNGRFINKPYASLYSTREWVALKNIIPNSISLNILLSSSFLLLCLFNSACLLTARLMRWRIDTLVRRALGASRQHILMQHVIESGLLGISGGLLALPLTSLGMAIVRMQPAAYSKAAEFSPQIYIYLLVLSIVSGVIIGIIPAWKMCTVSPALQINRE